MGRGSRLAGAVLAGVVGTGCQSQVPGSGAYDGPPPARPTQPPSDGPTGLPRPTAAPNPGYPDRFAGVWSGTIRQPNSRIASWTARLTMPGSTVRGRFEIVGYCSGSLTLQSSTANRLTAVERITSDPSGRCADGGAVTLELAAAGRARFRWVDQSDAGNVATGTITRR
jgi:hypothetical protein